jgi:hypothetical protein
MGRPPGWYPDPWRLAPWRWWDGAAWTGYSSPGAAPSPVVSPVELQRARDKEEKTWRWARRALVALLIVLAGQWLGAIWISHTFRHFWDQIPANSTNNGQVVEVWHFSPADSLYLDVPYVAAAAVAIVFMIWQHSAATVARGLGYPSRTSPVFGVGSWFIPVINLWFPYWALTDTLPPDHPLRGLTLWAWLAYLAATLIGETSFFVALASTAAAIVAMVIAGVFGLVAIILGAKLITAVNDDHRSRLQP